MYSLNIWDVSHLVHEERLLEAKNNRLIRQLMPPVSLPVSLPVSPLRQAHAALSRMLHYMF